MNLARSDPFSEFEETSTRLNRLFNQPVARRRIEDGGGLMPPFADAMDINLVACSTANVMVTASNAADRATCARTIHDRSGSCDGPFVAVCSVAVPTVDGAPHVDGWFTRAAGGTLFIDQIGELSSPAQYRLESLLALQSLRHERATSPGTDHRVRIITGSNRSLRADLADGSFSDTLFYRLNVIHIDLMHQGESA